MLVQALARYADTYLADQLAEMSVETKGVAYLIEIAEDGRFLGVRDRTRKTEKGKKFPEPMVAPRSPVPRVGTMSHPVIACDSVEYVVGPSVGQWSTEKKVRKHARNHEEFVKLITRAALETGDPGLQACARFYASPQQVALARADLESREGKPKQGFLVALSLRPRGLDPSQPGGPVFDRPAVREYWRRFYHESFQARHSGAGEGVCLISGRHGPIAITHDKIKRVGLGGQPAGVSLMSFNEDAFCSYGWEQNLNSPVSPERAAAYVLALNDLLLPGEHRRGSSLDKVLRTRSDYAGVGFLYWTREPVDEDLMAQVERPSAEDVKRLLEAPYTGRQIDVDDNEFFLLTVSGNGGRLVVHDWFYEKLGRVRDNVRQWFSELQVADPFHGGEPSTAPALWQLLQAVSPPDMVDKKINAGRAITLIRRALHGLPLGRSLLAAALGRLRVAQGADRLRPARLGLVRMCVDDILTREGKGGSPMHWALDEGQANPAYLCGRLLAMYEGLQYKAQGEVGQTVADRYYALASTYPALAVPKLETLSRAHLKKLRRDKKPAAIAIGRRIDELVSRFNESGFPGQLSLEDQGRFAIGYHHQRAEDQRRAALAKAEARQAEEAEEDEEAPAGAE